MIQKGAIVEHNGKQGVVVGDPWECCSPDETPVVFYDGVGFMGTPTTELKIIGREIAAASPAKCGAGQEGKCCIFITAGPTGICCERFSSLRYTLIGKRGSMSARRLPVKPFPACQYPTDHAYPNEQL